MSAFVPFLRRTTIAVLGAGAVLTAAAATATAAPAPGCTAGDITAVESGVAASLSAYFFTHPDVNNFFSGLQGLSKEDAATQTKAYMEANPQTKAEIKAIRGPVLDLRARCNIPTNSVIRGVL